MKWTGSEARAIIKRDLEEGGRLFGKDDVLDAQAAWKIYKDMPAFSEVEYPQFRDRLRDHRRQAHKQSERKQIGWQKSAAREILLADLEAGGILYGRDQINPEKVWEFYQYQPGFERVTYQQFAVQLQAHRKQMSKDNLKSHEEEQFLQRDRTLHPRQPYDHRGKLVFDMHPARDLLRKQVAEGIVHEGMTPTQVINLCPELYKPFEKNFKDKIHQMLRRQKWINWLNDKRLEKRGGIDIRPKKMKNPFD